MKLRLSEHSTPVAGAQEANCPDPEPADPTRRDVGPDESGGLTPYVPLYFCAVVAFTDPTPSDPSRYHVVVPGIGFYQAYGTGDGFQACVPGDGLQDGTTYQLRVEETSDAGKVISTSAARPWTYRIVKHPRSFLTSSKKVHGQWSYRAASTAKFTFKGTWEKGTRYSTQVWVSRTQHFTDEDWIHNSRDHQALVSKYRAKKPVMSVKIPRRLRGKYVWVSIVGWKNGKAGWEFTGPAEKVIAPR